MCVIFDQVSPSCLYVVLREDGTCLTRSKSTSAGTVSRFSMWQWGRDGSVMSVISAGHLLVSKERLEQL